MLIKCIRVFFILLISVALILPNSPTSAKEAAGVSALNNGLALTPPMGWNSWNRFGCNITDAQVRQMADAMVSSGMAAAGYQYIVIDDCWQGNGRTNGHVNLDPDFPNMKALGDYIHSKGLKFGIYSDRGTATCAGRVGSYGYETIDANDYASWGVDYLKYDNCNPAPGSNQQADYTRMRDALAATGRPIVYSICAWDYASWMPSVGNLWRTTGDISNSWDGMIWIPDHNNQTASVAGPGAWNDPDMLEVGNGGLTDTESRTHMSLWAVMAAPLIAGNDLRNMTQATREILTNPEVIAVDQDPLGIQGTRVWLGGSGNWLNIWSKPLSGTNARAVALFNGTTSTANITVNWSQIGLPAGNATVRDLWARADRGTFNNSYTASVPAHGTVLVKIVSAGSGPTPTPTFTNTPPPQQTNPIVWYRFDETGGSTATDSSGSGRNATLVNGPAWVGGRLNNAVDLNGGSQHVSLPAGIVNGLNDFSIATWVRLDSTGNWRRLFDFGSNTTTNMFLVPQSGSGAVRFAITTSGAGGEQQINGTSALSTGVWHHVAVTRSGNTGQLYVDGVQVGQNTGMSLSPASLGNTTNNWIGRSQYSGDAYLDGQVDDFRLYNRALSAAEVQALFNISPMPTPTPTQTPPPSGELLTNGNAEAGTSSWAVFGAGSLSTSTNPVHGGGQSLLLTGRTSSWNGISQNVTSKLTNGQTYTTNVWMRTQNGSPTGKVTLAVTANGTTSYITLAQGAVNSSGWTLLSGTATVSWTGTLSSATFYVETTSGTDSFYIDDASFR